ncbi:MAG: hypothetical protein KME16_09415 [Scytolyngbya sp. HA4215-MV1]|jgi:hypothetical protein|nr:hypothetical protein [Scytolyngbya sp. HA4215-MV1]
MYQVSTSTHTRLSRESENGRNYLQRHIMQKGSSEVPNLGCYAESFRLFTPCKFLGGKILSTNSYLNEFT